MDSILSNHTLTHQATEIFAPIPSLPSISVPKRTATKDISPFDIPSWLSNLLPHPTLVEGDRKTGVRETVIPHVTIISQHSPLPPHHTSLESSVTLLWESNAAPLPSRTLTRPTITGERFIGPTSTIQSSKVRATATSPSLVPEILQVLGPVPVTQTPSSSAISNANASVKEPSKTFLQNTGVAVSIFVTIGLVLIIFGSFLFPFLRRRIKLVDPEHEGASSEVPPVGPPALSPGGVRDTTETFWENTEHRRLDDDRLIHAFSNDDVDARSAFSEAFSDETLRHTELSVSRSDEYPSSYPASILPEYSHTQRSLLLPAYSDMSHFERSSSQQTLRGARGIIVSYDATGTQLGIL